MSKTSKLPNHLDRKIFICVESSQSLRFLILADLISNLRGM